jgi:hypothetical protein
METDGVMGAKFPQERGGYKRGPKGELFMVLISIYFLELSLCINLLIYS